MKPFLVLKIKESKKESTETEHKMYTCRSIVLSDSVSYLHSEAMAV